MTANPYRVLGPSIPPMLGRTTLVRQIERHLLKPSPDHVSVVGPIHYGKSVLLRSLAEIHRTESDALLTAVHVDLRRDTPMSDEAFKRRLAEEIGVALQPVRPQIAEYLELEEEAVHESLDLVFSELDRERVRVLVVLDGFDYVLAGSGLTRNLWDQLRSLAQKSSLRLVTGSRRPLRELCRTEESRTSDFWEIFYDTPIRVGVLDDTDWEPFLQPLLDAGCTVDGSARKEIANWTGGVPLLACALLQELWEKCRGAHLSKPEIDRSATLMLEERRELLEALWAGCGVEQHADLGALSEGEIPLVDLSADRRRALVSLGFGQELKGRLRASCRLMQRFAEERAPSVADLARLFGTAQGFESNVRSLMELRLAQVAPRDADKDLREAVSNAIREMQPDPNAALTWVRRIAGRALTLIWEAELPLDRTLPGDWIDEWRHAGIRNPPEDRGKLPRGAGAQCRVLNLITGTKHTRRSSRYVTRATYLLLDHIQSVGDFGQHREDYPESAVSTGIAAAFILAAIALIESLTADLQRGETAMDGGLATTDSP